MEQTKHNTLQFYPCINRLRDGTWRVYWDRTTFDDYSTNSEAENAIKEYEASFDCEEAIIEQELSDMRLTPDQLDKLAATLYGSK